MSAVRILLEYGCDDSLQDGQGQTALNLVDRRITEIQKSSYSDSQKEVSKYPYLVIHDDLMGPTDSAAASSLSSSKEEKWQYDLERVIETLTEAVQQRNQTEIKQALIRLSEVDIRLVTERLRVSSLLIDLLTADRNEELPETEKVILARFAYRFMQEHLVRHYMNQSHKKAKDLQAPRILESHKLDLKEKLAQFAKILQDDQPGEYSSYERLQLRFYSDALDASLDLFDTGDDKFSSMVLTQMLFAADAIITPVIGIDRVLDFIKEGQSMTTRTWIPDVLFIARLEQMIREKAYGSQEQGEIVDLIYQLFPKSGQNHNWHIVMAAIKLLMTIFNQTEDMAVKQKIWQGEGDYQHLGLKFLLRTGQTGPLASGFVKGKHLWRVRGASAFAINQMINQLELLDMASLDETAQVKVKVLKQDMESLQLQHQYEEKAFQVLDIYRKMNDPSSFNSVTLWTQAINALDLRDHEEVLAIKRAMDHYREQNKEYQDVFQTVHVDLDGKPKANSLDSERFSLTERVDQFLEQSDVPLMLLNGASGGGKSVFAEMLEEKKWENWDEDKLIPLFISLPTIKNPQQDLIEEAFANIGVPREKIAYLQQRYRFLFILDAWDEMKEEDRKELYSANKLNMWRE